MPMEETMCPMIPQSVKRESLNAIIAMLSEPGIDIHSINVEQFWRKVDETDAEKTMADTGIRFVTVTFMVDPEPEPAVIATGSDDETTDPYISLELDV